MRVLLANESRVGAGGVESYLSSLAQSLEARGHELALLYSNSAAENAPARIDVPESWSVADEGLEAALTRVRRWRPDVCFSHSMGRLEVDAALTREFPVVKMLHGYFGSCVSGQKTHAFPSPRPCARRCGPACLVLYGPRRCGSLRPHVVVRGYRWAARQRALFGSYRSIVVASDHMRRDYVNHGISPDRIHTIGLFTAPVADAAPNGERIDVLFLGRMAPLKGADVLAHALPIAASRLGDRLSAVFAGLGPHRAIAKRILSGSSVRAAFPGWVSAEERTALLRRATVVAVPSQLPEPFGLVGIEAAAAGVPAVAFDVGGIPEWLTDNVGGRLVPLAGGAQAFGAALADVLGSGERRNRLADGARAAAARFTEAAHMRVLEPILERAAATRTAPR